MPAQYDITDAISATAKQQFINLTQQLTISGSAGLSNALTPGKYRIVSDETCYILQGGNTIDTSLTSTAVGIMFPAGFPDEVTVSNTDADGYIAVIGTSGTFCISPK